MVGLILTIFIHGSLIAQSSLLNGEPVVQPGNHDTITQTAHRKVPKVNRHVNSASINAAYHASEPREHPVRMQQSPSTNSTSHPQSAPNNLQNPAPTISQEEMLKASDTIIIRGADLPFYLSRAEKGDTEAMRRAGICYLYGTGTTRDVKKGKDLIAKAALNENTEAQYDLGVMYRDGNGVTLNYPDAAYWFRKAARNGNAKAQLNIGLLFYEGKGVQQDYRIAAENFWRAAEQKNPDAAYRYAVMCRDGIGVPKDLSKAYYYFTLSTINGEYKDASVQAEKLKQYYKPTTTRKNRRHK